MSSQESHDSLGGSATSTYYPPPVLNAKCHHLEPQVTKRHDEFFARHCVFKTERDLEKFCSIKSSLGFCYAFPDARNDRIELVCRLFTAAFFFIDDPLERMSFQAGQAYVNRIISLSRGEISPDISVPEESIIYYLWKEIREVDAHAAEEILESTCTFWLAQADEKRKTLTDLASYLRFRATENGALLMSSVTRFALGLSMSAEEIEAVNDLDMNRARFITIVNDVFSWEMELKQSQSSSEEGSYLCSSIQIVIDSLGVDETAAKAILWSIARHLELRHLKLSSYLTEEYPNLDMYCKETGYHMSGIEAWHKETHRYRESRRYQK